MDFVCIPHYHPLKIGLEPANKARWAGGGGLWAPANFRSFCPCCFMSCSPACCSQCARCCWPQFSPSRPSGEAIISAFCARAPRRPHWPHKIFFVFFSWPRGENVQRQHPRPAKMICERRFWHCSPRNTHFNFQKSSIFPLLECRL